VGERVGDLFDHRFVKLGVGPADLQVDLFAEFLAEVANHTLEAAERSADLHHPQIERGVANRLDQGRDVGGGLHHLLAAQAVGDEGAGYWIGKEAIRLSLFEIENKVKIVEGSLSDQILKEIQAADWSGIKAFVYSKDRAEIAALSKIVDQAAEAGDAEAISILKKEIVS
jgi:hypothetical protein